MAFRIRRKKRVNAMRVGVKIALTIIGLYAGGFLITIMGQVMNGTCSPFYVGLKLIGWTVGTAYCTSTTASDSNTITATTGTGILSVVGVLAIAMIVTEFVDVGF